ncbi:signal peptide-containing protein [Theileria equi strain WA]|uniref:Signal peptide-containing protein n=1 Tax=Theileria equi strain WA TaxID=1537102 RepID=L0AW06_THEEQ|nr:signal peptide-containing protein [Theileria equi strain WA]AFZ79735.1 signal peptide-containing protein [Theileria equi strain WA]|eukprot:XP_004829401.1 signal peptide-containing protein [Theileria equi strain WA]
MNVFFILVATCLVGLCHCQGSRFSGNRLIIEVLDDYAEDEVVISHIADETRKGGSSGKRQIWDLANGTAYEVEYTLSSARRYSDEKVADVAVDESPVPQTSRHTTTLDISSPDEDKSQSFDYTFTANAIRLVVPNKDVSVSKLVNGTEEVYTLSSGETLDHAKVYLNKDGKPELVLVVTKTSSASKECYLELKDSKWVPCSNIEERIKGLRDPAEWESDFDIDISSISDTTECSIFETELLGVTTKYIYPKAGHNAMNVNDGSKELWKSAISVNRSGPGEGSDACLSCLIHKNGSMELLEMIVVERLTRRYNYFEKVDGKWTSIDKKDYDKKLKDLKNDVTNQSSVEESKKSSRESPNPSSHPSTTTSS